MHAISFDFLVYLLDELEVVAIDNFKWLALGDLKVSQGEIVSECLGGGSLAASELAQLANVVFSVEELVRVPPLLKCLRNIPDLLDHLIFSILILIGLLYFSSEFLSFLKEWLELEVQETSDQLRDDVGQTKVILMFNYFLELLS